MYATKRSVTKGAISRGEISEKKNKEPKHSQRKIDKGCEYRVQLIKDEHGFVKKRIIHYSPKKLEKIHKYNKMLEEYKKAMQEESAKQFEGENDVKGMEAAPAVETPEAAEAQPSEVIATE